MTGTVHVVESDSEFRATVQRLLVDAGWRVRTYAAAGDYLVPPPDDDAGCLLLDPHLPGISGLDLQDALERHPEYQHPIVFLSGSADVADSVRAMRAGAREFLVKPVARDVLLCAVSDAVAHDVCQRANRLETSRAHALLASLRTRERRVLAGIAGGLLHKQLAAELAVSERTIKAERARIMRRLGVRTLPALLQIVQQAGGAASWRAHEGEQHDPSCDPLQGGRPAAAGVTRMVPAPPGWR